MRTKLIPVILILFSASLFPAKVAVLNELMKPNRILMDDSNLYITEGENILIYSREDFKLKEKFGKKGEGPGELIKPFYIIPIKEKLYINSMGKVSYYTKKGEFLSEMKNGTGARNFFPLSNGFAGFINNIADKEIFFTVNLYGHNLEFVKELYREQTPVKMAGKIELFRRAFMHKTYKDRIYISGKDGFVIDCLDTTGKLLFTIKRDNFKKHKITAEDKKNANKYFKLRYGDAFEQFKHQIVYPEYFPEIRQFNIADDRIYILPYEWNETGLKFYIYSTEGRFLSEQFIPLKLKYSMQPYPFVIKDNRVFQLVENEDTEEWELHMNKLKL